VTGYFVIFVIFVIFVATKDIKVVKATHVILIDQMSRLAGWREESENGGDCLIVVILILRISRPRVPQPSKNSNKIRIMKVIIKHWTAVASWHWDMPEDDVCGICRNPYDSTCSQCRYPGEQCPLRESPLFSLFGGFLTRH
jgi:hypothetical protein